MYPMNWIFMFCFFSLIFYIFLSFTYFFMGNKIKFMDKNINKFNFTLEKSWKNCW